VLKLAWRLIAVQLCIGLMLGVGVLQGESPKGHAVLMISIDGMRPDYVLQADLHGLKIPVLRNIAKNSTYAQEVVNVNPTVTYPNHTTLVTGVWPPEHGIFNNSFFDPLGLEQGAWNWYGAQVKAPTLWQAAKASGLVTASVLWPVTVHAQGIDYNVPEYWRTRTEYDHYLLEAVSTPGGFLEEAEKVAGPFHSGKGDIALDETITRTAIEMITKKHPDLITIHIVSLDHEEHQHGPFSPEANSDLEKIDEMVGRLIAAERQVHPDADTLIVSDHGFLPVTHHVNLNAALAEAGFITIDNRQHPRVVDWKAYAWDSDGSAAIILRNKDDKLTMEALGKLLANLAADPKNGINLVLDHAKAVAAGITQDAAFLVDWKSGFCMGSAVTGPIVEDVALSGTHGYLTVHPELHSAFFMEGPNIAKGKNLGIIDMRQIAPTVARELGIVLPSAKLPALPVDSAR
jgi:predicted AlkP superfamily pyrophosphatase or phosphodiesterase